MKQAVLGHPIMKSRWSTNLNPWWGTPEKLVSWRDSQGTHHDFGPCHHLEIMMGFGCGEGLRNPPYKTDFMMGFLGNPSFKSQKLWSFRLWPKTLKFLAGECLVFVWGIPGFDARKKCYNALDMNIAPNIHLSIKTAWKHDIFGHSWESGSEISFLDDN